VGTVMAGFHWDYVFMDDVCSQKNTQTPDSIEKLWKWFGETLAQLDPGQRLFMIGTLHHFSDIYCRIMKDPAMRAMFDVSVHAWCNPIVDPESEITAELFFPGRLTRKFVANQKKFLVPRQFACFYENRPQTAEQQHFKPEYFRVIRDQDVPGAVWTYMLTDFAFVAEEKKDKHDRTVFWIVSLDCNRVAYVRDFYVGRWKPSDSCRIACDIWKRYQDVNMKAISIEKTTHQDLMQSLFEEVRRQVFVQPRFVEIAGRNQEVKDIRIEAIEPRFRRGDIYFVQSLKDQWRKWKPLIDEMTEWPFSTHDDIPDALSDLDKRDEHGKLYLPGPPSNFSANSVVIRQQPSMIDGKLNPDYGYPAREFTKAGQQGQEIWRDKSSTQGTKGDPRRDSLFQGSPQQNPDIFRKR